MYQTQKVDEAEGLVMEEGTSNFYRMILNHLTEGVYFVDTNRMITFWNKGAERITGFSETDVLHKACHWNLLMHTDLKGGNLCESNCPVAKTLTDGVIREETLFLQHKQGYRVPVSVHIMPMRSPSDHIVGAVEIFSDMNPSGDYTRKMKALATLAYFDLVTGLTNRRYVESRIMMMLSEYQKNLSPFGILLINIIGFKMLNDMYGQEIGDQVLQSIARNLASGVGPTDIVSRWDGTRFLVLSSNTKKTLLMLLAEKLRTISIRAANANGVSDIVLKISMAGTMGRIDDTPLALKHRIAKYIRESEERDGAFVMDED
ncbi:MAG TPA: diguanylate cyclase [Negativicutes bacterium]|nr:diguanylate cyclase [Negativicutes bacterium]